MDTETLYDKLGEGNLQLLVDRFYDLVFRNEQISHLFKVDKASIKEKQLLFLTQFFWRSCSVFTTIRPPETKGEAFAASDQR